MSSSASADAVDNVRIERHGAVAVVLMDRPPLNLLSQALRHSLSRAFESLGRDESVRAVVLGSRGPHFCAGADMNEFEARLDRQVARAHWERAYEMTLNALRCPKPIVAAIRGVCFGGGCELSLACDFRVAEPSARLGLPEISRGNYPGSGGLLLLRRLVGESAAKKIVLDGAPVEAREARALGVVDRVADDALAEAMLWATDLAEKPARAVATVKRLIGAPFLNEFVALADEERDSYVAAFQTLDAREGRRAFLEKRNPVWSHR